MKFSSTTAAVLLTWFVLSCAGQVDEDAAGDTAGAPKGGTAGDEGGNGGGGAAAGASSPGGGRGGGSLTGGGGAVGGGKADAGLSPEAGLPPVTDAAPDVAGAPGLPRVAITAAGYAGRRITSFDNGTTWVGDQRLGGGGDDEFLLRDVAFGAGRVVAVGWKILSSTDGVKWTEHRNPHGQWNGGVAWGNSMFLAAGGLGRAARSTDGVTWEAAANAGNSHIRRLVFSNGFFWATGDGGTVYRTADGRAWTAGGSFPAVTDSEGSVRVRMGGDGVQVTVDGTTWRTALKTSGLEGVSIGRLP